VTAAEAVCTPKAVGPQLTKNMSFRRTTWRPASRRTGPKCTSIFQNR